VNTIESTIQFFPRTAIAEHNTRVNVQHNSLKSFRIAWQRDFSRRRDLDDVSQVPFLKLGSKLNRLRSDFVFAEFQFQIEPRQAHRVVHLEQVDVPQGEPLQPFYKPGVPNGCSEFMQQAGLQDIRTRRVTWRTDFGDGGKAFDFFAAISASWWYCRFPPNEVAKEAERARAYFVRKNARVVTDDIIVASGRKPA